MFCRSCGREMRSRKAKADGRPGAMGDGRCETCYRRRLRQKEVVKVVVSPDWKKAACAEHEDPEAFFDEDPTPRRELALDLCRFCPIIMECGQYAIDNNLTGVWGGAWREPIINTTVEELIAEYHPGMTVDDVLLLEGNGCRNNHLPHFTIDYRFHQSGKLRTYKRCRLCDVEKNRANRDVANAKRRQTRAQQAELRRQAYEVEYRERADLILREVQAGVPNKKIAGDLGLSTKTVERVRVRLVQEGRLQPRQNNGRRGAKLPMYDRVFQLKQEGKSGVEIATIVGVTPQRVSQILRVA